MIARITLATLAGAAWISSAATGFADEASERANVAALAVAPAALLPAVPRVITGNDIRIILQDPAIRNGVGLSENSWDFSASDGVPGFGPILVAATRPSTTMSCAERDVQLITSIEDRGSANDVASDRLAAAAFSMLQARSLCGSGSEAEALALYDDTLRALTPMHAAR